jgi:hypothetical protein
MNGDVILWIFLTYNQKLDEIEYAHAAQLWVLISESRKQFKKHKWGLISVDLKIYATTLRP